MKELEDFEWHPIQEVIHNMTPHVEAERRIAYVQVSAETFLNLILAQGEELPDVVCVPRWNLPEGAKLLWHRSDDFYRRILFCVQHESLAPVPDGCPIPILEPGEFATVRLENAKVAEVTCVETKREDGFWEVGKPQVHQWRSPVAGEPREEDGVCVKCGAFANSDGHLPCPAPTLGYPSVDLKAEGLPTKVAIPTRWDGTPATNVSILDPNVKPLFPNGIFLDGKKVGEVVHDELNADRFPWRVGPDGKTFRLFSVRRTAGPDSFPFHPEGVKRELVGSHVGSEGPFDTYRDTVMQIAGPFEPDSKVKQVDLGDEE